MEIELHHPILTERRAAKGNIRLKLLRDDIKTKNALDKVKQPRINFFRLLQEKKKILNSPPLKQKAEGF